MYQSEKDECLLDGVAIKLQYAPYMFINQNHVFFLWSDDVKTHNTPVKCNQTEVSMNVMSVRGKKGFSLIL